MRPPARRLKRRALDAVPLAWWRRLAPRDLIAPCYHLVSDRDLPHVQHYPYKTPTQFEADLAWAGSALGFVSYDEARRSRGRTGAHPGTGLGGCLVTFDDGFAECHDLARPILLRHGAGAVFFVTADLIDNERPFYETRIALCIERVKRAEPTVLEPVARRLQVDAWSAAEENRHRLAQARGRLARGRIPEPRSEVQRALILWLLGLVQTDEERIDGACELLEVDAETYLREQRPYLTSDQLRALAADGFTIGGHGLTHRRLQDLTPEDREKEILESCDRVRQITGQETAPFAFPYSGRGILDSELADLVRRHPWVELLFDTGGLRTGPSYLVQRFVADTPPAAGGRKGNLERLVRRAWSASVFAGPRG